MSERGRVGPVARALGFTGLLPQVAAVAVMIVARLSGDPDGAGWLVAATILAGTYPLAILSFLGGMWWGLAMRSEAKQSTAVALAVIPSLLAVCLAVAPMILWRSWTLVVTGGTLLLTLLVDRWLISVQLAPSGWWRLRVPLSTGLGGLTIVAGAFALT